MARTEFRTDWPVGWSEALQDAAPSVPDLTAGELEAVWERVETAARKPRGRRSRWRTGLAGLAAVAVVGAGGAATAGILSAHTGRGPVDAEDIELGGPGERLNPQGSDFAAVLEQQTRDIRFPSPATRASALSWEVGDLVEPNSQDQALVSVGALRLWMAGHALCAWSNTWALAVRAGDTSAADGAAKVILGARHWPAISDTDPELANESEFDWLPDLERAVRTQDFAGARKAMATNQSCMPGLAPELGLGKRW